MNGIPGTLRTVVPVLVILTALMSSCGDPPAVEAVPNIVLVMVDTQRADHMSCYGYGRETTPVQDSLAASGTLFTNVQAQSSWTLPAIASIMTGLTPREHGAGRRGETIYGLAGSLPTIPGELHAAGYECIGYFNVYLLSSELGFHRGFDSFHCDPLGHGMAGATVDSCIAALARRDTNRPFALFVHLFDPHDPYDPPDGWDTLYSATGSQGVTTWAEGFAAGWEDPLLLREHLVDMYDAEIAWTDNQLGRLFSYLRQGGLDSSTVVILTADHGEEFLEHNGTYHGKTMFQEVLEVPLIISGPGIPTGSTVEALVGQVDILPAILSLAGLPAPEACSGRDLMNLSTHTDAVIPSSNLNSGSVPTVVAVRQGSSKVITNLDTGSSIAFDLVSDPGEIAPVMPDSVLVEESFEYWAAPRLADPAPVNRTAIDAALRDLGYI